MTIYARPRSQKIYNRRRPCVVEVWQTRQDFESHLAASHTKAFREKLQPMLGSPFDERLHKLLP